MHTHNRFASVAAALLMGLAAIASLPTAHASFGDPSLTLSCPSASSGLGDGLKLDWSWYGGAYSHPKLTVDWWYTSGSPDTVHRIHQDPYEYRGGNDYGIFGGTEYLFPGQYTVTVKAFVTYWNDQEYVTQDVGTA